MKARRSADEWQEVFRDAHYLISGFQELIGQQEIFRGTI